MTDLKKHLEELLNEGFTHKYIVEKYEGKVLKEMNPELSYFFAKNITGANIIAHGDVVICSKDLLYNYKFARDITGANILAHSMVILESCNFEYNLMFARDIKGADRKKHRAIVKQYRICEKNEEDFIIYNKVKKFKTTKMIMRNNNI